MNDLTVPTEEEILARVRKIEFSTRQILESKFSGQYHTRFKGQGMQFSEFREYYPGDDIRHIDWKVTARTQSPHIRKFEEERDLTFYIMADVSASRQFGSATKTKGEALAEVCALIAFGAVMNNDRVGLILFSDQIEKHIPAKKGRTHAMRIVRDLLYFRPQNNRTSLRAGLEFYLKVMKHRAVAVLASDFYDSGYEKILKQVTRRHDIIALRMRDVRETEVPSVGQIEMRDPETGEVFWVDTSSYHFQKNFKQELEKFESDLKARLLQSRVEVLDLWTHEDYFSQVVIHFRNLKRKRR